MRRCLSLIVAGAVLAGCSTSSTGPEDDPDDLPSIAGAWTLALNAFPAGTTGSEGRCTFDPISIQLTRGGETLVGVDYSGTRDGFTMTCTGFTDSATVLTGWGDTTLVLTADTMSARVNYQCVGLGFQCLTGAPSVSIWPNSELQLWATAALGSLSGEFWYRDGVDVQLTGSWSAAR